MAGVKKTKKQMDALIRAIAPKGSKEKVYLGYQFPIKNLKIVRKKRSELRFTSSVRGQRLNLAFRVEDYKIPKIEEILLSIASSFTPDKKISTEEKPRGEDRGVRRKYGRNYAIIAICIIIIIVIVVWFFYFVSVISS